jgi:hypothetical protein
MLLEPSHDVMSPVQVYLDLLIEMPQLEDAS